MLFSEYNNNMFDDEEIHEITFDDIFYEGTNNPITFYVKNGDTLEYISSIINNRKFLVQEIRSSRDNGIKSSILENLKKIKTKEDLVKKIKSTLIKFSTDDDFNYRECAEIIKNKDFFNKIENLEENIDLLLPNLNDEILIDVILNQVVFSLEKYTMIHPKIKLILNELGKDSFMTFTLE